MLKYKISHVAVGKDSFSKTSSRNLQVDTTTSYSDDIGGRSTENKNNYHDDYSKICRGEIHVRENFLTPDQVERLQKDIFQLQQQQKQTETETETETTETKTFRPSGLSNRVAGDRNEFGSSDRLTCTITPDLWKGNTNYSSMRLAVEEKLENIKMELEKALSKPNGSLELAEMYYSLSPKGSHLPRHQDERHEMTKGDKGWINETRRSISWLIYLNNHGWRGCNSSIDAKRHSQEVANDAGSGGELRAHVRKCCKGVQCGSHDGNIQVGWLRIEAENTIECDRECECEREWEREYEYEYEYEPVFLDSWVKTKVRVRNRDRDREEDGFEWQAKWQALSALYRIRTDDEQNQQNQQQQQQQQQQQPDEQNQQQQTRDYISQPFGPNSPSWPNESNLEPVEFANALALQLNVDQQSRFVGVEDIRACKIVNVVPKGGTLVLFDSATVPHEVLETQQGNRMAIAGWYHEAQQDFPEWYGS